MNPEDHELQEYIREQETISPAEPGWDDRREDLDDSIRLDYTEVELAETVVPVLGLLWDDKDRKRLDGAQNLFRD